jgi:DNA invertase Pin-like site-specific DNA recombinase
MLSEGVPQKRIAEIFGCYRHTIRNINNGKTKAYAHLSAGIDKII